MRVSEWQNCYDDQWTGLIVPEAFSHPAKFAPGLIKRIYEHCIAQGYVKAGGNITVTEEILAEIKKDVDNGLYQKV